MKEEYSRYFAENQKAWDAKVDIHKASKLYDLESFKAGKSSLVGPEVEELGMVQGKSLLHFQCHFGLDTLSWVRRGARAVGVDFSSKAIEMARELNQEEEERAQFVEANIYELRSKLSGQYDIVYTSYGSIGWLPDIDRWAETVAYFLKPGGTFYMVDFHPLVWMLDDNEMREFKYSYFNKEVISTDTHTFTDRERKHGTFREHGWNHSISALLNALSRQDLKLIFFNEFDYSSYECFPNLVQIGEHKWQFKGREGLLPMMYSLKMEKQD